MKKIPATVVTGFLGAGKTTLIRHLLDNANGRRIALIINEFGDLGVDGDILKGCGDETCSEDDIIELSNGCICCTVAEDFIPTMEALLARPDAPDHIVIETSGLALPQPLVRAFQWPQISTRVTVDGVVTVVDGKAVAEGRFAANLAAVDAQRRADDNLDHETPLSELFEDQIAAADMIVVNKTDLLGDDEADALAGEAGGRGARRRARGARRPWARCRSRCCWARAPRPRPTWRAATRAITIITTMTTTMTTTIDHHHHHDHDDFESFVVERAEIADPAAFAEQVAGRDPGA